MILGNMFFRETGRIPHDDGVPPVAFLEKDLDLLVGQDIQGLVDRLG